MNKTKIEWTDSTWNPIRGCSRVSEGCRNCYAEKVAYRFSGAGQPYEGLVRINAKGERKPEWNGQVRFVEKHLLDPLRWKPVQIHGETGVIYEDRPRRIFVNSMSDLFHENVIDEWIALIFGVMAHCPQHTFQILTKRPERALKWISAEDQDEKVYDALVESCIADDDREADRLICRGQDRILKKDKEYGLVFECKWPLPNVWLGVSVENQKAADDRLDYLCELASQGWSTMVSFEPLLGAVDPGSWWLSLGSKTWAIVGGESGPGARPMHPDWARSLRDQCVAAGVPYFFKQWGEWVPKSNFANFQEWNRASEHGLIYRHGGHDSVRRADEPDEEFGLTAWDLDGNDYCAAMARVGKHAAGALLDGREWREFPLPQQHGPVAGDPEPASSEVTA